MKYIFQVKSERSSREGASCTGFNNKFDQAHFFAQKFAPFLMGVNLIQDSGVDCIQDSGVNLIRDSGVDLIRDSGVDFIQDGTEGYK